MKITESVIDIFSMKVFHEKVAYETCLFGCGRDFVAGLGAAGASCNIQTLLQCRLHGWRVVQFTCFLPSVVGGQLDLN